ncbi:MAG: hypothetical protein M3Y65_19725 [Pseudomonadota bacterium]|nr:hypothetical protein [Pseudomonadota bacterium]
MYALKVRINEEAPIIAGADDLSVLNATVNCVGKLGSASRPMREDEPADVFISVGGLTSRASDVPDEHLNWISQKPLKIGDLISVEVVETSSADAPISGKEAEKRRHDEREYFEHCKKAYLKLREKYEAE